MSATTERLLNLFAGMIGLASGIWMIYHKIVIAPKLKDINSYLKAKLVFSIPIGLIAIIAGLVILIRSFNI